MNPSTSTEASEEEAPVPGLDWNILDPVAELFNKSAGQIIVQFKLVILPDLILRLYSIFRKGSGIICNCNIDEKF